MKLLKVLSVRGVRHPARILLLEGANDSSSCMRQNTFKHVMKDLVAERSSKSQIPGPNTPVMLSSIKLPELLLLELPLAIFILDVDIVRLNSNNADSEGTFHKGRFATGSFGRSRSVECQWFQVVSLASEFSQVRKSLLEDVHDQANENAHCFRIYHLKVQSRPFRSSSGLG